MIVFLSAHLFVHVVSLFPSRTDNGSQHFVHIYELDHRMTIREANCTDMVLSQMFDVAVTKTRGGQIPSPWI